MGKENLEGGAVYMKSHSKGLPCQSSGWTANAGLTAQFLDKEQASGPRQNIKEKQQDNKFNKDFKNFPNQKKKKKKS